MEGQAAFRQEPEDSARITIRITEAEAGVRLDKVLGEALRGFTRSALQKLMEQGCVTCQGKPLAKNYKPSCGDEITVLLPPPELPDAQPEDIPLDIVYEDDDLLVVNKPKGMVVHPAPGNYTGTLVNAPVSLRQLPFRHQRDHPARHCPPHRQGHQRAARRCQKRRGALPSGGADQGTFLHPRV